MENARRAVDLLALQDSLSIAQEFQDVDIKLSEDQSSFVEFLCGDATVDESIVTSTIERIIIGDHYQRGLDTLV